MNFPRAPRLRRLGLQRRETSPEAPPRYRPAGSLSSAIGNRLAPLQCSRPMSSENAHLYLELASQPCRRSGPLSLAAPCPLTPIGCHRLTPCQPKLALRL